MRNRQQTLTGSMQTSFQSNERLLAALLMLPILNGYLSEILTLWRKDTITDYVYMFVFAMAAFSYLKAFLQRTASVFCAVCLILAAPVVTFFVIPEIYQRVVASRAINLRVFSQTEFFTLISLCMPLFLLCLQRMDPDRLYRYLRGYSIVVVAMFIAVMLLHVFVHIAQLNYMSVAYNSVFSILLLYYDSRENKKRISTILWMVGAAGILAGGCRGAALLLVALIALWELRRLFPLTAGKVIGLIFVVFFAVIFIMNFREILTGIDEIFSKLGYSSRLLEKYFGRSKDGDLFHMDDRNKIYNAVATNIKLFGHGVYSDRLVLDGSYAHNIVLEILYQFGWILGLPLLLGLAAFVLRTLKRAKWDKGSFLHFCVFSFGVYLCTKMMVSASYLTDRTLWLYLGLCLVAARQTLQNNEINDGDMEEPHESL